MYIFNFFCNKTPSMNKLGKTKIVIHKIKLQKWSFRGGALKQ